MSSCSFLSVLYVFLFSQAPLFFVPFSSLHRHMTQSTASSSSDTSTPTAVTTVPFSPFSPYLVQEDKNPSASGTLSRVTFKNAPTQDSTLDTDASSASGNSILSAPSIPAPTLILSVPDDHDALKAKKQGCFARRKCLWISLIVTLLLLIAAGIAAYFLLPSMAQLIMNGATVHFQSIHMSQPTLDSFQAGIQGRIENAGPFPAQTLPMLVTVSYEDVVLGEMNMPAQSLNGGAADLDLLSTFSISNVSAFESFLLALLKSESVEWRLQGNMTLTVLNMEMKDLVFDKRVVLTGMKDLANVKVLNFTLSGENVETMIVAELNNPSPISFTLGTLYFDMMFQDAKIGRVMAPNVSLASGVNTLTLSGALVASAEPADRSPFSTLFSNYLTDQPSVVQCIGIGLRSENNSAPVSWMETAVLAMNMSATLQPPPVMDTIQKVSLNGIDLNLNTGNATTAELAAKSVVVDFALPFDIPIQIMSVRQDIVVMNTDGVPVATANMSEYALASNEKNIAQIVTSMPPVTLNLVDEQLFGQFLTELFLAANQTLALYGRADVLASTPVGHVVLSGVTFKKEVETDGMQGLQYIFPDGRTSNPIIRSFRVLEGRPDKIILETDITLYSPSTVTAHLGDVVLGVYFEGTRVGSAVIQDLVVAPGDNNITNICYLEPHNDIEREAGSRLLSNSVNGIVSNASMVGSLESSNYTKINMALSHLNLTAPFPTLPEPMVAGAVLKINPLTAPFTNKGETAFILRNSLDVPVTIYQMDVDIFENGDKLGHMDLSLDPRNAIRVRGLEATKSAFYPVNMTRALSKPSLEALLNGMRGKLAVETNGSIHALIGSFPFVLNYVQANVPTSIDFF